VEQEVPRERPAEGQDRNDDQLLHGFLEPPMERSMAAMEISKSKRAWISAARALASATWASVSSTDDALPTVKRPVASSSVSSACFTVRAAILRLSRVSSRVA